MSRRGSSSVYDKTLHLLVYTKSGNTENRDVNINVVTDLTDCIHIKLRDTSDFLFNYSLNIDSRYFAAMKIDQNLDIDFNEFKSYLVEMLDQVTRHEMFLKGEIDNTQCRLIFYGKSRIKSLVFLMLDLISTDQIEIFTEMNQNLTALKALNSSLKTQLNFARQELGEKSSQLANSASFNQRLETKFVDELHKISFVFSKQLQEFSGKLLEKLLVQTERVLRVIRSVKVVKNEFVLKGNTSTKMAEHLKHLRLEKTDSEHCIGELRKEISSLKNAQIEQQNRISELNRIIESKDLDYAKLQEIKDEIEADVRKATLIIAQKSASNEEIAKDLLQANQMLVNFNHLFETKKKEIGELEEELEVKNKILKEVDHKLHDICQEFKAYKQSYNSVEINKLTNKLFSTNKRVEELEKLNRETNKLNELLTRKMASGDFINKAYNK